MPWEASQHYDKLLEELRQKESGILKNNIDGIRSEEANTTVNEIFNLWRSVGLEENMIEVSHTLDACTDATKGL